MDFLKKLRLFVIDDEYYFLIIRATFGMERTEMTNCDSYSQFCIIRLSFLTFSYQNNRTKWPLDFQGKKLKNVFDYIKLHFEYCQSTKPKFYTPFVLKNSLIMDDTAFNDKIDRTIENQKIQVK